ncbi:MAG: DUF5829 family protein [Luteitalea sp.]
MSEPLRLNHLYRVVDAETFAAARDSAWLREVFAPSELRTTTRPDWAYTGLYWYGTATYFELFEAGAQGPAGSTGVAFAVETAGATAPLAAHWRQTFGAASSRIVVRPIGDEAPVPWFQMTHAEPDRLDRLHLWAMEYHADFLAAWHASETMARGITRAEVLERYTRVVDGPVDPLLDDVLGVTLALTADERDFFARHLAAFDESSAPAVAHGVGHAPADVVQGDGITFALADATAASRGVQEIVCRLRRAVAPQTLVVGRSTVDVDGDRLVWTFRDQPL